MSDVKNIIAIASSTTMPNIIAQTPRNNSISGVPTNGPNGVSAERITKNITDSIQYNKGVVPQNKEIQLIQAYQH